MDNIIFHISLYDVAFLGILFIGLTVSSLLWFANRINQSANRFLSMALFIIILAIIRLFALDINLQEYIPHWNKLPLRYSLALGPLLYFYVLKITKPEYKFPRKTLLHFIPVLIEIFVHLGFQHLNSIISLLAFLSLLIYLYKSLHAIENFYQQLKVNEVNDRYRSQLRWLRNLLKGYGMLWLLWVPFAIIDYFNPSNPHLFYSLYIVLAISFIRIAIICFFREDMKVPVPLPASSRSLVPTELRQKGAWLKQLMKENLYYRDEELTLRRLAEILDMTSNELSRIINSSQSKSFNDFINEFRVAEVIRKMKDPANDRLTLIGIGMDAGFNSKTTFNRVFRQMTGRSPAEYKEGLKNERPKYTLGLQSTVTQIISEKLNRNYMVRTYFKTAWRNIKANRLFAYLNLAGLSIGICVCIILFACASYELSFDSTYKNSKNIYRVNMQAGADFDYKVWAQLPGLGGPAIAQNVAQVKSMTRLLKYNFGGPVSIKTGGKTFTEKGLYMADTTILSIFDFDFVEGNKQTALNQINSVIISASARKRLYGTESAFGKIIYADNRDTFQVSGVYKDFPENSTIDCDMVYNIMDTWFGKQAYWGNSSYETYLLLQAGAKPEQVQKQATALIDRFVAKKDQFFIQFILQPLMDIHLHSADIRAGFSSRIGNITTVNMLLFLSILVLVIACINYINLATARVQKRAKDVGVNKVLGADKQHLLTQFYMETALLSCIAIILGYAATFVLRSFFQDITGIALQTSALYTPIILFGLLFTWLLVTLIAGSYPAISMARISPLVLMKKLKIKEQAADYIRKALVTFQFAASIILIIAVLIVLQQINYMRNKDLGYNPKGIVAVPINAAENIQQVKGLQLDLKQMNGVESVSPSQSIPGDLESGKMIRRLAGDNDGYPVKTCNTSGSIVKTMELKLLAGTSIPETLNEKDTLCYLLINESVSKYLGYKTPQDAIGRYANTEMDHHAIITGVVRDFNYQSLKNNIGGYVYYIVNKRTESLNTLLIRYNTANLSQLMQQLQKSFKTNLPNASFDYEFLDEHIQNLYANEQHTIRSAIIFAILAIFVACLGLFGLAASVAEQRTREIGIRKVLGSSITGIVRLLTSDFLKLVLISIVIATPVAWYIMHKWLTSFSYRITVSPLPFIIAGMLAIVLALLTVSSHAIKAALGNPVKSLRTE